jgi:hypothetical protein
MGFLLFLGVRVSIGFWGLPTDIPHEGLCRMSVGYRRAYGFFFMSHLFLLDSFYYFRGSSFI